MLKDKTIGLSLSILASVIWGISSPLIKFILKYIDGIDIALFRSIIVLIVLYLWLKATGVSINAISHKQLKSIFLLSLTGATVMWLSINLSIDYSTAIEASLITSFTTPLTITIAFIYLGERLKINEILSIFLGLLGIFLVITRAEPLNMDIRYLVGYILALLSSLSWALYTIGYKKFSLKLDDRVVLFYMFLFATPFFLVSDLVIGVKLSGLSNITVLSILVVLGVLSTVIGFWLFNISIRKIGASLASIPLMLIPFIATILSWIWLNERVPLISLIGGAFLILSIGIAYIRYD